MRPILLALTLAAGCNGDPPDERTDPLVPTEPTEPTAPTEPTEPEGLRLTAVDHLVRASMSLRGLRPSAADVLAVHQDRSALEPIVRGYVNDPAFGLVLRDMHHEQLLMRNEDAQYPAAGPLETADPATITASIVEEPLALVAEIVTSGEPYTAVVTADYTVANAITALAWGHRHDPTGPEWQRVPLPDARPGAGVLSTSGLWVRHPSNGRNNHRERAALVAKTFLCVDFLVSDVPIDGTVDLTDDAVVADALQNNPSCVTCHQDLDPIASSIFGFREALSPRAIAQAYLGGCEPNPRTGTSDCYPVPLFDEQRTELWQRVGMRAPGLFGTPVDDLDALGDAIATDPGFARCSVRRFAGWFGQMDPEAVPAPFVTEQTDAFVSGGFDAKALAADLLLSDPFAQDPAEDGAMGLLTVRPEQYARVIEQLTGFRWLTEARGSAPIDLALTDRTGYRTMAGGVDGETVPYPSHQVTPVKSLVVSSYATEAAAWIVREDTAARGNETARLLRVIAAADRPTDEAVVREQLVELYLDVLSLVVTEDSSEVDAAYALFTGSLAEADASTAWTITLSALLQDPRLLHY